MLNILLQHSIQFRLGLFMYTVHLGLQPKFIINLYCENNYIHNYNTRQQKPLHLLDELDIYIFFSLLSKFRIKSLIKSTIF